MQKSILAMLRELVQLRSKRNGRLMYLFFYSFDIKNERILFL